MGNTIAAIDITLGEPAILSPEAEVLLVAEEEENSEYKPKRHFSSPLAQKLNGQRHTPPPSPSKNADFCEMRSQMLEYQNKKKEYQEKAKTCYQAKKFAVASYYSGEARQFNEKIQNISQQIVQNLLSTK